VVEGTYTLNDIKNPIIRFLARLGCAVFVPVVLGRAYLLVVFILVFVFPFFWLWRKVFGKYPFGLRINGKR